MSLEKPSPSDRDDLVRRIERELLDELDEALAAHAADEGEGAARAAADEGEGAAGAAADDEVSGSPPR